MLPEMIVVTADAAMEMPMIISVLRSFLARVGMFRRFDVRLRGGPVSTDNPMRITTAWIRRCRTHP